MKKSNYELKVLVNDREVTEYYNGGKFYLEARDGTEYSIKIKNHGYKRLLAVISVDGIDVIGGGAADIAETGYIVNAYDTLKISGYRVDTESVAKFKFGKGKDSYSTMVENDFDEKEIKKNGASRNNGVIGVRIWEEKEKITYTQYINQITYIPIPPIPKDTPQWPKKPYSPYGPYIDYWYGTSPSYCSNDSQMKCLTSYAQPDFELGTAWGEKVEDKVIKTTFDKEDTYTELELFYVTRKELTKMGIDLDGKKKVGFPKAFEKTEFCKKPKNWKA